MLDPAKGNEDSTNATLLNAAQLGLPVQRDLVPSSRCSSCMMLFGSKDDSVLKKSIDEQTCCISTTAMPPRKDRDFVMGFDSDSDISLPEDDLDTSIKGKGKAKAKSGDKLRSDKGKGKAKDAVSWIDV